MSATTKTSHRFRRVTVLLILIALIAAASSAQAATAIYQITTDKVYLRAEPDKEAKVLLLVRLGSEVTLLSSDNEDWYKVRVNGTVGYMSADYLKLSGLVTDSQALTAIVTADKLNVRVTASSTGRQLGLAKKGESFTVNGYNTGWLQIEYKGQTAYIASDYVRLNGEGSATPVTVPTAAPSATAAPNATAQTVIQTNTIMKVGSKGDDVKALQQMLITLGYLSGSADGIYGTTTRAAVINFQKTVGLKADGSVGQSTLNALNQACVSLPTGVTIVTPTATAAPDSSLLKKGVRGDAVKALQQNLIALGYLAGEVDGIFGTATQTAVRAFQAANGLKVDGQAGEKTLAAIQSAIAATNTAQALSEGDRGSAVKSLQQKLVALGYLTSAADGIFGVKTKAAVASFQSGHSLTATGSADAATQSAINIAYSGITEPANNDTHTAPGITNNDNVVVNVSTDTSKLPTIKYGATGSYVEALQKRLLALGYFKGTVGGNFGTLTQTAVINFQTGAGLKADGIVGSETWTALYASNAPSAVSTTLTEGDEGNAVETLQARLKELGYYSYNVDGDYGSRTTAAVAAFQIKVGMTADGVAGPTTLTALYAANAPKNSDTVNVNPGNNGSVNVNSGIKDTDYTIAAQLVALAKKQMGCKYIYAHQAPPYFDCSGLTWYCYKQYGYTLKRTAYEQGYDDTYPKITSIEDLQLGDCVYFNTNERDSDLCDHAAIYLGDYNFIHASSSAGKVTINSLTSGFYKEHFSWGRRVLGQN